MTYYARPSWALDPHPGFSAMPEPVPFVFVHHFVRQPEPAFTPALMRELERIAMAAQPDLIAFPYHRAVFGNGDLGEGRPWGVRGGATYNYNDRSYAWCFVLDGRYNEPPVAALQAVAADVRYGLDHDHIRDDFQLLPHDAVYATECPGPLVKDRLAQLEEMIQGGDVPLTPGEIDAIANAAAEKVGWKLLEYHEKMVAPIRPNADPPRVSLLDWMRHLRDNPKG